MKNVYKIVALVSAAVFCAGCGKATIYPQAEAACVEAQKAREQMKTASGDDRALLEARAKGFEEACRDAMRERSDQQSRSKAPIFPR